MIVTDLPPHRHDIQLRVGEMDCPSCLAKIQGHLRSVEGVRDVQGNVIARTLTVSVDRAKVSEADVQREVGRLGYAAVPIAREGDVDRFESASTWRSMQARRVYVAVALALGGALTWGLTSDPVLYSSARIDLRAADAWLVLAAFTAGWNFFPKGLRAAWRLALDMNFLMTVAIFGALLLGEFVEAAAIGVLFGVAELLESYSVDRARASIQALMKMAPENAVVLRGGVETTVPAATLMVGDEVLVHPGERVPADGTVVEGASAVDQSPITGESLPVDKAPGSEVFSGTINHEGHLRVRVDRPARDSALAKIVRLVEEAESRKTRSERFVERFARYYTPVIAAAAVVVALVPPLFFGGSGAEWVTRGLTLLVIACPCALVISTPVAVVSGLTSAARNGVLIKGGTYLEALASVRVFALDKTGTFTVGHPSVQSVIAVATSEDDALSRAADIERLSKHPLARAIVDEARARGLGPSAARVTDFAAIPGMGARAKLDGEEHVIGRPSLFPDSAPPDGLERAGHSVIGLTREGTLLAWIAMADRPREEARWAIDDLRLLGIERIVMLTGDNQGAAEAIGSAIGVRDVRAGLMPEDKLALVKDLEREYGAVAMVGDGVNDAPALAAATVGIAMGAAGSDTALETADVALMGDDLSRLPYLVRLSRRGTSVIRQNIAAAIAVKAVLAVGVPLGFVSLIAAVLIGDLGVSLAVTANALRLGRLET